MKMKVIMSIVFAGLLVIPAEAQLKFGIRGGVNSANVKLKDFNDPDYRLEYESSTEIGFHFGAIGQLKVMNFVLQPEILFTTAKADIKFTDLTPSGAAPVIGRQKFNKLDVPVIAGFKFGPLKLQAGPVATVMINSKSELLTEEGFEQSYKGMTLGYQVGAGLELASLLLDVKYEGNLSALGDGVTIRDQDLHFDQRMSQWILSLGFLF
jgi:hypothetical protein